MLTALVATLSRMPGSHDTRVGRESAWPRAPSGTHGCRPLTVKGLECA